MAQYHTYRWTQKDGKHGYIVMAGSVMVLERFGFTTRGRAQTDLSAEAYRQHWTLRYAA